MVIMDKKLVDYIKLLSKQDSKNLTEKTLKTVEEVGELAKCVLPFDNAAGTTHRFVERTKILEEVCDSMLCLLSIAYNLEYDDEDIEQMIRHKTKKWADLLAREGKIKYPIPYEIHVTVHIPESAEISSVEDFKNTCNNLKVKPVLLDLHLKEGAIFKDLMTSSTFMGNNKEAYEEMKRISDGLTDEGWAVIREKIETIPWHPAAPSQTHENPEMPPNCYFECHLNILCSDERYVELKKIATKHGAHLSQNAFKKFDDGTYTIMMTYRNYYDFYEDFMYDLDGIKDHLSYEKFKVEKEIVEFSIYDTKVSHDAEWINQ